MTWEGFRSAGGRACGNSVGGAAHTHSTAHTVCVSWVYTGGGARQAGLVLVEGGEWYPLGGWDGMRLGMSVDI